jgi:hypothetical protein
MFVEMTSFFKTFWCSQKSFQLACSQGLLDPCAYGETIDKEVNFDVDCDNDKEIKNGFMGYKNTHMIAFVIKCTKCDYMTI